MPSTLRIAGRLIEPCGSWQFVLGVVLFPIGTIAACMGVAFGAPGLALGIPLAVIGALLQHDARPYTVSRAVRASADGVWIDASLAVRRDHLRAGFVVPQPYGGAVVLLERRRGAPLRVELRDVRNARALLRVLRLDARRRMATFSFSWGAVDVGADGICIAAGAPALSLLDAAMPRPHRFVAYRDVRAVTLSARGVTVDVADGIRLVLEAERGLRARIGMLALIERITEGIDQYRRRGAPTDVAPFSRGAAPVRQWLAHIRAVARGTYRTPSFDRARLLRTLEDPRAEPSARVGAALVLRASRGAKEARRIRIVAEATASTDVRAALEAIAAQADDAELERAVAFLEAPNPASA